MTTSTLTQFLNVLELNGSTAIFHRHSPGTNPCPCRTPEGYRDPIWHLQHTDQPMCDEAGYLDDGNDVEFTVKAFVQPIQSTRATRLRSEQMIEAFGEIQEGDHIGIFPCDWQGNVLNFFNWGVSGQDWIEYDGRRFTAVHSNVIPDPERGGRHHWEIGLRLISDEEL